MKRKWIIRIGVLVLLVMSGVLWFRFAVHVSPPDAPQTDLDRSQREQVGPDAFVLGNNWMRRNRHGIWEVYVEGKPFERGVAMGILTEELRMELEEAFVAEIERHVPSFMRRLALKYFLAWYCKDLPAYVPEEYELEIYGASTIYPEEDPYAFVGPRYQRKLFYHAAHDIGHAVQNMNLVGCSSFAEWGAHTMDEKLLIGRNFDFYAGDEFARHKVLYFVNPAEGLRFASLSWPGFSGVVSGLNESGLSVTLNSAKTGLPPTARTPVSIIARDILQYAQTIEEAFDRASETESFVSETFLIGSARDGRAALIEKTPDTTILYLPSDSSLLCTNHFQSAYLFPTALNQENYLQSASGYRYERLVELLSSYNTMTPARAASVLRDRRGKAGDHIGEGHEKALNQLICHHSVIIQPEDRRLWVSTPPWNLGSYLAYDLDTVFALNPPRDPSVRMYSDSIGSDGFLDNGGYEAFVEFRQQEAAIKAAADAGNTGFILSAKALDDFALLNPQYYLTYLRLGDYHYLHGELTLAKQAYRRALGLELNHMGVEKYLQEKLAELEEIP